MRVKLNDQRSVLSASTKLAIAAGVGVAGGVLAGALLSWKFAPLIAWDLAALAYLVPTWLQVLGFDAELAKKHALREDPSRVIADLVLVVASVASLAAVVGVLLGADGSTIEIFAQSLLALLSIVISWFMVHTVNMLRYAELYYRGPEGGVDFAGTKHPVYSDFAYLPFTVGMTYQVSDTDVSSTEIRRVITKHGLLSFLFGTTIIAATINLIAGLGQ
jgi:uncharacterized membrane protein